MADNPFGRGRGWDRGDERGRSGGGSGSGSNPWSGTRAEPVGGWTDEQRAAADPYSTLGGANGNADFAAALLPFDSSPMNPALSNAMGQSTQLGRVGLQEAARLQGEEDRRFETANQFLQAQFESNQQKPVSSDDLNTIFARDADRITQGSLQQFDFLRGHLGGSGIRGGVAADLGLQAEMQRMGQLTGAKRDMHVAAMQENSRRAMQNMSAATQVAAFQAQSPSAVLIDQINNLLGVSITREGIIAGQENAREAADAARDAGEQSMFGSLAGGVLGLVGAAFGL